MVHLMQVVTKALHRHGHEAALWIEAAAWWVPDIRMRAIIHVCMIESQCSDDQP